MEITVDNVIIAGHGRVLAAQKLGLTEVPVVIHSHLNDNQRKAYTLLNNRLAETGGGWDTEMLKLELDELPEFDLSCFGEVLEGLLEQDISLNGLTDDDEVPEPPKKARTELGRIYQLGKHRLMCGDSTSEKDIGMLMDGVKADICFTSPPYNAGKTPTEVKSGKSSKYENYSDDLSDAKYESFLYDYLKLSLEYAEYSFCNIQSISGNKTALINVLYRLIDVYADTIIWDKLYSQPAMQENVLNSEFEYVHIFSKKANRSIGTKYFRGTLSNILHLSKQTKNKVKEHNATFPIEFVVYFIASFCTCKGTVLDVFGGSGTTLIACEQTNRQCRMMELDPIYCDVIVERYCKLKGIDSDKVFETGVAE